MTQIEFQVNGLHCKSCKTLLEGEVGELAGVKDIKVNYQTGNCQIEFDRDQISFSKIKEKIESFDYQVEDWAENRKQKTEIRDRGGVKIFAISLLIPLVIIISKIQALWRFWPSLMNQIWDTV
ncbi:MAG: cation transporter [Patescibacteria group bacterium]